MIANALNEICLNQLEGLKNGYVCCKAYPEGVPADCYCSQHCDFEFLDETKELPDLKCPKGFSLKIPDGYLERRRKEAENY